MMKKIIFAVITACVIFLGFVALEKKYGDQGKPLSSHQESTNQAFVPDAEKMSIYPSADQPKARFIFWVGTLFAGIGLGGMFYTIVAVETKPPTDFVMFRKRHGKARVSLMFSIMGFGSLLFTSWPIALFIGVMGVILYRTTKHALNMFPYGRIGK